MINDCVIRAYGSPRCELCVQHKVKFNLELFSMSLSESEELPPSPKAARIEAACSRVHSSGSDSVRKCSTLVLQLTRARFRAAGSANGLA